MWLAFSAGLGSGDQTDINNVRRDTTISQLRLGLNYSLSLSQKNSLKFTGISGIRFQKIVAFDLFGAAFSHLWLDKIKL
jgi:hypothetical protein